MNGITLALNSDKQTVEIKVEPRLFKTAVKAKSIYQLFRQSEFCDYLYDDNAVLDVCEALAAALENDDMDPIQACIAQAKDAEIAISIAADKMSAQLTLTSPYMGKLPNLNEILLLLKKHQVTKGVSKKRVNKLIESAAKSRGGKHFDDLVARGLPARNGKDSYVERLVPDALERILTPTSTADGKIDMRDFGDILCVKSDQVIAKIMPPSNGRKGFTVTGQILAAQSGKWRKLKLGKHVYLSGDENTVLAKIPGLPKVGKLNVDVDDVFMSKGVNISTGNINFEGSIIVNGDITEKMKVKASGNITINGFVESAQIQAGGDVIITQGASGKLQQLDCELIAGGNVYLVHAQGVNISSKKDIFIDKQLAYSNIKCLGNITVGKVDNPLGKIFASTIICKKKITAGYVGAVSGSSLRIDYSEYYNAMLDKHERMNSHYEDLASKNADHEIKISNINNRKPSGALLEKVELMNEELALERDLINWLRINLEESKRQLVTFKKEAKVIATKALYPGVTIVLNKRQWQTKKECGKCQVVLENKDWAYEPL